MKCFKYLVFPFFVVGCFTTGERGDNGGGVFADPEKQALLMGTFHYHNPGADVAKTKAFDILSEGSQEQLDSLTKLIRDFNPSKIFVEWSFKEQRELDSLYQLYRQGIYFDNPGLSDFYRKNEIFQLAFRVADSLRVEKIYAVDYLDTEFPFDSMMQIVGSENQIELQAQIQEIIGEFTSEFDDLIDSGASLIELTQFLNSARLKDFSNRFHCRIPLLIGGEDNFIGPFLTAEWYKRNLYMWSIIQKKIEANDSRILILLGASHIAMIEKLIEQSDDWDPLGFNEFLELTHEGTYSK